MPYSRSRIAFANMYYNANTMHFRPETGGFQHSHLSIALSGDGHLHHTGNTSDVCTDAIFVIANDERECIVHDNTSTLPPVTKSLWDMCACTNWWTPIDNAIRPFDNAFTRCMSLCVFTRYIHHMHSQDALTICIHKMQNRLQCSNQLLGLFKRKKSLHRSHQFHRIWTTPTLPSGRQAQHCYTPQYTATGGTMHSTQADAYTVRLSYQASGEPVAAMSCS